MKSILSILTGLILVSSIQANACPRSANQLICPGDTIVSSDNIVGTVMGVNPFQGNVAFRSTGGYTYTRDKQTLALGIGCLDMYCVGDRIVSSDSIVGTILAVNPYNRTVGFRSTGGYIYTRQIETLALGLGCVRGVCVDDTVISSDNITAKVLAVNPYNRTVGFRSTGGYIYTRQADSLSSSEYCDTYGQYPRTQQSFPLVNEKIYVDINFKFSIQRPLLP